MKVFYTPLSFWHFLRRRWDVWYTFPGFANLVREVQWQEEQSTRRSVMIEMLRQHTESSPAWDWLDEGDKTHLLVSIAMKQFPVENHAHDSEETH